MKKRLVIIVVILLITLGAFASSKGFSTPNNAPLPTNPSVNLTESESQKMLSEIALFNNPVYANIQIEIPIKGIYDDGDVLYAKPHFIKNGVKKKLTDSVVYYDPWNTGVQSWRNPVSWTKDGKAILLLQGEQKGPIIVDKEGNMQKINTPLYEVFVVNANPTKNEVALMGTEIDDVVYISLYIVDLNTLEAKQGYKSAVDPGSTGDWLQSIDYSPDGTLYFDAAPSYEPSMYSISPSGITTLIKKGAMQPRVSPDGKYLAYSSIDNRYINRAKNPPALEVLKIGGNKLGSVPAFGLFSWSETGDKILIREQTSLKEILVSDKGISPSNIIKDDGSPFVIENRPSEIYVVVNALALSKTCGQPGA